MWPSERQITAMRWLKWGIGIILGLALAVGGGIMFFSYRVAREVASVERTIVVPLPTRALLPTATTVPTIVAAVGVVTPVPLPTALPFPTPTVVVPPNVGKVLKDGVTTAVNDSDGHEPVWQGKQYIHILLLGVDRRDDEPARSDTMIIVTVDLWSGVASMLSIPRDLIVTIPGWGDDRVKCGDRIRATRPSG